MPRRLLVALLLITGCTMNQSAMTSEQATKRVEQLIRDTAAALTPRPRLELIPFSTAPNMCLDEGKSHDHLVINRKYWLRDIPKSENMSIARQVRADWDKQGHVVLSTGGWEVGHPSIGGESRPDQFILALTWAEGDDLYLAATSPCVRAEGSPGADPQ
jgi:hypothetical protein